MPQAPAGRAAQVAAWPGDPLPAQPTTNACTSGIHEVHVTGELTSCTMGSGSVSVGGLRRGRLRRRERTCETESRAE